MSKKSSNAGKFQCICSDCLTGISKHVQPGSVNLAVVDSPYNIGQKYDGCDDKKTVSQFLKWFDDRIDAVKQVMAKDGTIWVFMNDALVSEVDMVCKSRGLHKRTQICWYYTFGQNHARNFTPSHTHILRYSVHASKFVFNDADIRQPSARQVKYNDKRANPKGRVPDNTWILFPEQMPEGFDPAGDTWLFNRVCGTYRERKKHSPNQIPIPMMERILLSTSNPGDLVLDPFMGTGSLGCACKTHQRRYIGFDISRTCVLESQARIEACVS